MGVNALEVRRRVMLAQPHEAVAVGAVASFRTDLISPLKMQFDLLPIQDLHGQANPYPAGGSAQIWDEEWEVGTFDLTTGERKDAVTYWRSKNTIPVQPNTLYYASTSGDGIYRFWYDSNGDYISYEGSVRDSAFLSPANAYFLNIVDVSRNAYNPATDPVSINYPSTDHDYHPWKNICPIYGHDSCETARTGKNMLVKPFVYYNTTASILSDCFFIKKGEYIISFQSSSATNWRFGVRMLDLNGNIITDSAHLPYRYMSYYSNHQMYMSGANTTQLSVPISIIEDCYVRFVYGFGDTTSSSVFTNPMLRFATDNRDYYERSIFTQKITFPTPPGTVYGCHFADNGDGTGTLTVDKEYIDGETTVYSCSGPYRNIYGLWVCSVRISGKTIRAALKTPISDSIASLPDKTYTNVNENGIVKPIANFVFGILALTDETSGLTASSTSSEVLTAFDNYINTLKPSFVYDIGEPISYTLSLTAIQSLIGQNHIWVDNADSVSVEYWGH